MRGKRFNIAVGALAAVVIIGALRFTPSPQIAASNLPKEINDATFWQMVNDFSEPGGSFRSDNFVSNERDFQFVIGDLKKTIGPGSVYLGVGPDQNFTYIVALEPRIAFIVDIRRQNMLQHLMYKALIELSSDRIDFLSRLFSRKKPEGLDADAPADSILQAYLRTPPDHDLFEQNQKSILDTLSQRHHFTLSEEDVKGINYVYTAFFEAGPDLTYSFSVGRGPGGFGGFNRGFAGYRGRGMPTYAELMMMTDREGHNRSYLGSAENFKLLKEIEEKNLIVPVVGDFAGPKALRAVGKYLKEHDATVGAFYTSNVEQYLFQQDDDWRRFYTNVGTLPLDGNSTFIRSVANNMRYQTERASLISSISDLLRNFNSGRLGSYYEVIRMSH